MGTGGEGGTDSGVKNTVFFDHVRVPAFALVGGENQGWKAASTHLELEHGAGGRIGRNRLWERLLRYCQETKRDGVPLAQHPDVRDVLADIYIKGEVTRLFGVRNFWLTYARRPRSYEGPQLSYYRKTAGLWMTGAILEAVGPAAPDERPDLGLAGGLPRAPAAQRHRRRSPGRHHRHPAHQHGAPDRHRAGGARSRRHRALGGAPRWICHSRKVRRCSRRRRAPSWSARRRGDTIVALQRAGGSVDPGLWRKASDLGWLGILVPAEYGGSGQSLTDAAVLYEEMGRGPLPGPFFGSGILGALILMEGATEVQRTLLLPAVARGERVLSVAITEPNGSWGPQGVTLAPQRLDGGYRLDGAKLFVSDAVSATDLIVAVRTGMRPPTGACSLSTRAARGVSARALPGFVTGQARGHLRERRGPRLPPARGAREPGLGDSAARARPCPPGAVLLHGGRLPGGVRDVGGP